MHRKILEEAEFQYSDDVTIHYQTAGKGSKNIIFLHGFACSRLNWHSLIVAFPLEKYTLFIPDLKGFGESSAPRDNAYTLHEQAKIIAAFVTYKKKERFILVGHSMGGGIALILCTINKMKESISSLILLDSAAFTDHLPSFVKLLKTPYLRYLFISLLIPHNSIIRYATSRVFYDKNKVNNAVIQRYKPYFYRRRHYNVYIKTAEQIIPEDYENQITLYGKIDIPTLLIWGKQDPVIPLSNGVKLSSILPQATLKVIDGCGHHPHEERPELTAQLIQDFLRTYDLPADS